MLIFYLVTLSWAIDQLTIEDGYNSIKYEFCQNQFKEVAINQEQFNNPSIQKLLKVNETELTSIIGKNATQRIISQGYFYYTQKKRCAGFIFYDYHIEYQQQWQSLKTILNQSKIDISKHNCSTAIYAYDFASKSFHPQCKTYYNNSYSLNRSIQGEGLHQQLNTQIFIKEQVQGWIIVIDFLDIYTYVDKDELDKLSSQEIKINYRLLTIIDIERPSEFSNQHLLITKIKAKQQYNYQHQYHFRYQMAGDTHYKTSYAPADTLIYNIKQDLDDLQQILEITQKQQPFKQLNQHRVLQYEVPVGYQDHNGLVLLITLALTLGFSVHLAIQILLSDRKKLK